MKFRIETMFALAALAALGSCSADERITPGDTDRVAVNISGGMQTRAANNLWEDEDAIGITMFRKATGELAEGDYKNCKYLTAKGPMGYFHPATAGETLYFPKDGSEVDFMAYYPYSTEMKADYKMPLVVANQSSLGKLDFMTSEHLEGTSKETPNVKLRFYHRLSKVIFRLKVEEGQQPERLVGSTLTINGMTTKGTYDLMAGTLEADLASMAPITVPTDAETGAKAEGIVLPRPAAAGITFNVKLTDGSVYMAKMSEALDLEPGYKYTFNITLKKTEMTVTADIQDWIDAGEEEATAHAIEVATGQTDDYFQTGDKMELFVTTSQASNQSMGIYTYAKDVDLWTNKKTHYWEDVNGTGTVTFNAMDTLALAPAGTHQMHDILLAHAPQVKRYGSITLPFVHAASMLIVKLQSPEGGYTPKELETAILTLPDFLTGATFEHAIYAAGTQKADIVLTKQTNAPTWQGCIQPQVIPAATIYIKVVLHGNTYTVSTPIGMKQEFLANKKLTIIITLSKKELGSISATITDWGLLPDIDVDTDIDK